MPKIIKDIEENIMKAAFDLFGEYGYREVNMKMIATEVNIAVGTLYNYYPNKRELFISVFKKSWQGTFCQLNKISDEDISPKEKVAKFINVLYDEISKRKGLGRELFKEELLKEKEENQFSSIIKEELFNKFGELIKKVKEEDGLKIEENLESKLIVTVLLTIVNLMKEYPNQRESNIKFINQLLECAYLE